MKIDHHLFVKVVHKLTDFGEPYMHVLYCGAVFIEAHGLYAWAAGGLGVFVALSIVFDRA